MGVYRAGVRVIRALTPAPSCSSSDDEEELLREPKIRKTAVKSNDVGSVQHMSEGSSDLYQVGEATCRLPEEIFELCSLGEVLSLQSWNECLSDKERQQLCAYLPEMEYGCFQKPLRDLFNGQNMFFGSPLERLWQDLRDGLCDPCVLEAHKTLASLQRREYYHDLRHYHNGMVNSLMEMRELWMSDPMANLEEKLSIWNAQKISESAKLVATSQDEGRSKCTPPRGTLANDGGIEREDLESGPQHTAWDAHEGLSSRPAFKLNQGVYHTSNEKALLIPARVQVQGDQPKTTSKFRTNLSSRGKASQMNQTSISLEGTAHRSDPRKCLTPKELRAHNYVDAAVPVQQNGRYRFTGVDASEAMMRGSSKALNDKVHKTASDKQVPSGFGQNQAESHTKRKKRAQSVFVPTLTPGFTFSTLNFLSAVRAALVGDPISDKSEPLPFREIVARVKSCPGDARVLELQMPLDCLIRGALKSLSPPPNVLAMYGFEPLVSYNKVSRQWSWVGHMSRRVCTFREVDLQAVSKIWSMSDEILSELPDIFEKWLKTTETTLRQLWQLAQIAMPVFPIFPEEKERFGDLRAQKSSGTIPDSSYEMRALFQREELVRYSTTEIAFRYTTADGRKSAVAPLKKLGGKSKAKARDHFMLRPNRPSHITVLCLVRDAASRLPQGIGTRADVCTLLRDSQFIENVSDAQLSHVVSGALDRLHYERDPCVVYNQDRRLWLYLHGDRDEEDFEEGGTVSTRISRRKAAGCSVTVSPAQGNSFNDMSETEAESDPLNDHDGSVSKPTYLVPHHEPHAKGPIRLLQGPTCSHPREEMLLPFIDVQASVQSIGPNMQTHPMGWELYKGRKELSITN